jgi:hypothetical protein
MQQPTDPAEALATLATQLRKAHAQLTLAQTNEDRHVAQFWIDNIVRNIARWANQAQRRMS